MPDISSGIPASRPSSRKGQIVIALLVTAFIIYGSLYPFEFRPDTTGAGPVLYLIGTWQDWDGRGDLLSNILLYLPFGFFTANAFPLRLPSMLRGLLAILIGTALSTSMELVQFYDAGRVTSMGDVYANAIGASVGATAAVIIGASVNWPLTKELAEKPGAAMLLAAFLGYRLFPYVPTIDLHKYWHTVRDLLQHPIPSTFDLLRFTVIWLFIAAVIESFYGLRRWLLVFPLLALGTFGARILIVNLSLAPADVAGALCAGVAWVLLIRWLPFKWSVMAIMFGGLVMTLRLEPFTFSSWPTRNFGWVPLWSLMNGSVNVAIQAFLEKFYQYGGLIWLCDQAGLSLASATGLVSILLFGTSYAEIYLPGRSGEITDTVIAIAIGISMAQFNRSEKVAPKRLRPRELSASEEF